jgi:hypothetical protein
MVRRAIRPEKRDDTYQSEKGESDSETGEGEREVEEGDATVVGEGEVEVEGGRVAEEAAVASDGQGARGQGAGDPDPIDKMDREAELRKLGLLLGAEDPPLEVNHETEGKLLLHRLSWKHYASRFAMRVRAEKLNVKPKESYEAMVCFLCLKEKGWENWNRTVMPRGNCAHHMYSHMSHHHQTFSKNPKHIANMAKVKLEYDKNRKKPTMVKPSLTLNAYLKRKRPAAIGDGARQPPISQDRFEALALNLLASSSVPLVVLEDPEFLQLLRELGGWHLNFRGRYFWKTTLEKRVSQIRSELTKYLHGKPVCLSFDVWSRKNMTFSVLGIVACVWDQAQQNIQYVALGIHQLKQPHTGLNIRDVLETVCKRYQLQNKDIVAFTTDAASNLAVALRERLDLDDEDDAEVAAELGLEDAGIGEPELAGSPEWLRQLNGELVPEEEEEEETMTPPSFSQFQPPRASSVASGGSGGQGAGGQGASDQAGESGSAHQAGCPKPPILHLRCTAHQLALVAKAAISRDIGLSTLIGKVTDLIGIMHKSGKWTERYMELAGSGIPPYSRVRWLGVYPMMKAAYDNRETVTKIIGEMREGGANVASIDPTALRDGLTVLRPLWKATNALQGDMIAITRVFTAVFGIKRQMEKVAAGHHAFSSFAREAASQLGTRYAAFWPDPDTDEAEKPILLVAACLDPYNSGFLLQLGVMGAGVKATRQFLLMSPACPDGGNGGQGASGQGASAANQSGYGASQIAAPAQTQESQLFLDPWDEPLTMADDAASAHSAISNEELQRSAAYNRYYGSVAKYVELLEGGGLRMTLEEAEAYDVRVASFWAHSSDYGPIKPVVVRALTVCATSANCERLFTAAGRFTGGVRASTKTPLLNARLIGYCNLKLLQKMASGFGPPKKKKKTGLENSVPSFPSIDLSA